MRRYLKERRERNQRLGKADAANRCAFCKRALPKQAVKRWDEPERYCNDACYADAEERKALR